VEVAEQLHAIVRLHRIYHITGAVTNFCEGIMIVVETEKTIIGQQQMVVKPILAYIKNISKTQGITSCTFLGDGSISLILDAVGIVNRF
jgi:two-component system, chemotaxis family, sensor kinase CheA